MSEPVDLRFHVVDAGQFVRVDATGKIDMAASLRMAREIAAFGDAAAQLPVLLDVRGLRGELSTLDIVQLVKALLAERERYRRRLALLARDNAQLGRAHFLENYSQNRGIPIAAFVDYDEAAKWLSER